MFFKQNMRMGVFPRRGQLPPPYKADLDFNFYKLEENKLIDKVDVSGNTFSEILGGWQGVISNSSAYLEFDDLTGITIVSSSGTSTPTISGNRINLSIGTFYGLELSDGSYFGLNNHFINSKTGV